MTPLTGTPNNNGQVEEGSEAQNRKRTPLVRADLSTESTAQLPVRVGVIGAGAWGTALAATAKRADNNVLLWAREEAVVNQINTEHTNIYLPDVVLSSEIRATTDLKELVDTSDVVLLVSPAQFTRSMAEQLKPIWDMKKPLVLCAKGIEISTGNLLSDVVREIMPDAITCVLSGPGFAIEVAKKKPTAVTIAAEDKALSEKLVQIMGSTYFRPYSSTDIITPQVCGALKNVIAIASGVVEGKNLGDNARAALISRGLHEMARFAKKIGGHMHTAIGLSGVGDLVLTASSTQSRNYALGFEIGKTGSAREILANSTKTVEGVSTTQAVMKRAREMDLEMPICEVMEKLLFNDATLDDCLNDLLFRPFKSESF